MIIRTLGDIMFLYDKKIGKCDICGKRKKVYVVLRRNKMKQLCIMHLNKSELKYVFDDMKRKVIRRTLVKLLKSNKPLTDYIKKNLRYCFHFEHFERLAKELIRAKISQNEQVFRIMVVLDLSMYEELSNRFKLARIDEKVKK